jgi:hypothetical protein
MMLWEAVNHVGQQGVFSPHTDPDTKRSMNIMQEMLSTMTKSYGYVSPPWSLTAAYSGGIWAMP